MKEYNVTYERVLIEEATINVDAENEDAAISISSAMLDATDWEVVDINEPELVLVELEDEDE